MTEGGNGDDLAEVNGALLLVLVAVLVGGGFLVGILWW
jgi:hypothetical protein